MKHRWCGTPYNRPPLHSPAARSACQATQDIMTIDMHALDALNASISENLGRVSRLGARVVALSRFVAVAFPHLPASECATIERAFREQINDAMSMTSDEPVPGLYEEALLTEVNLLLAALKQRSRSLL
ncbi:hypothetical protein [Ralstonia solanacearum]|nr:hypothetical protein [Ralstonia solanacearum]